ncbi:MAG: hypothetical protein AUI83_25295 [Armatimonadetes bacterium 13_1_40CM_3_65_7]|nr:MAG: hypothetical protein AUI83_25295 [Armatimonadetes bacterium 13_1_40CM_3_65_7]
MDPATGTAKLIVPDYQLSLAIGKEGQNARLAAKLTGFRIDIKSETQSADEDRARRDRRTEAPSEDESPQAQEVRVSPREAKVVSHAAEAPEVEVAAPGDGSVSQEPEPAEPEASASA